MVEGHRFRNKTQDGYWTVECFKTGGSFSTKMWANESVPLQRCPCCNETIRKSKLTKPYMANIPTYLINEDELHQIIQFCRDGKDKDLEGFIKRIKSGARR